MEALITNLKFTEDWFKTQMNGANWLSGRDEPMMIDIYCYPMLERCLLLKDTIWAEASYNKYDMEKNMPTLFAYVMRFRDHPLLKDHCITSDGWAKQIVFWTELAKVGGKSHLTLTIFDKTD